MKTNKIIGVIIISVIFLAYLIIPVNAADYPFTFTVDPESLSAKPGDTITVDLGMADIDQSGDGINAIQGDISYDENIFENVDIVSAGSNWSASLNKSDNSNLKGRFVINNMNNQKSTQVVGQLKAKIKSGVTASTATIELKDIFSSYGNTDTSKSNKTITVKIITSSTQNSNNSNNNNSSNSVAQKTTNKENISKASNLPKTGLNSWIGVAIVLAIIGVIVGYICYKKTY